MKHEKNIDEARLNGAAWVLHNKLVEYGTLNASQFNNIKECLSCAIKDYLEINKPREFVKGHWYPCVEKTNGVKRVLIYMGHYEFSFSNGGVISKNERELSVGKSLGEIKFDE